MKIIIFCLFFSSQAYTQEHINKVFFDTLSIIIPLSTYASTYYMNDDVGRVQFYKSFATNMALTYGLKVSVNAPRPDASDKDSFPSGHTSIAFQSATFIHKRYGLSYALATYIGASVVGYSRVAGKKHYPRDVIAGALLGYMSSWYFTSTYKNINIVPFSTKAYQGIYLKYCW